MQKNKYPIATTTALHTAVNVMRGKARDNYSTVCAVNADCQLRGGRQTGRRLEQGVGPKTQPQVYINASPP